MLKKVILFGLLAFVAHRILNIVILFGFHKTTYEHYPGPCRVVNNINHGSEDMAYIPGDKVLITSGVRFVERWNKHYKDSQAGVFMFDFNHPQKGAQPVTIKGLKKDIKECDFHGMSVWPQQQTGHISVFIVNHLDDRSVVEIFQYDDTSMTLHHLETAFEDGDSNIRLLNDVAAVGPRQLYVTNYLYTRSKLEMFAQVKWGTVVYFDGSETHVATSETLHLPNGISASNDGKYIYMAHISGRELITFKRNGDNSLTVIEKTPLYSMPDNIMVDPDNGDLWLGCHPIGFETSMHLDNPDDEIATSQVLRIRTKDGSVTDITEVLVDDGKLISGSSVAAYRKNVLLVGSVAHNTLICDVKYAS